jgi:ABC-type Fe3+-hydroxamate transport system substrate-binding protein
MPMDALGRDVVLAAPPRRIVSLVPSLTDFLFAIGGGGRVAGITDYCTEPAAQVADLPRVRGTKNPDRERVAALRPDVVLASKEENRERDVLAFEERGIPVYVTDICSVAGALAQLGALAEALDMAAGAAPLLGEMRAALEEERARQAEPWRVLVFIWRDPWMAVGADTYADDLLAVCGAENLARRLPGRYPRAALDAFLALEPDVILLPDEPYRFGEADRAAFAPFAECAAVREGRVLLCDGALLTWYGPRTAAALRFFGQVGRSR